MDINQEDSYEDLLNHLKLTVESLLRYQLSNVWGVYGGIHRLHAAVIKILKHGFRFLKDNGEPDFWVFIQGLSWLQPTLAASPSFLGHPGTPLRSPLRNTDKAMTWLHKSIENHTLSEKLAWLISDHEHLLSCYKSKAFLRQNQYSEATLICLKAVEQLDISLLSKIDPPLYLKKKNVNTRQHRRCLSYPESKSNDGHAWAASEKISAPIVLKCDKESSNSSGTDPINGVYLSEPDEKTEGKHAIFTFECTDSEKTIKNVIRNNLMKKSFTTSDIYLLYQKEKNKFSFFKNVRSFHSRRRSLSVSTDQSSAENNPCFSDLIQVRYDKPESYVRSRRAAFPVYQRHDSLDSLFSISSTDTIINKDKIKKHKKRKRSFFKLPFRIWETSDDEKSNCSEDSRTLVQASTAKGVNNKKSFIENGGSITLPMSIGSFPKPSPGQSIISFLTSGVFTQINAELDRENAHFNISEALIAALEQVKCNQQLHYADEILEESDEEINRLKRIIQIRRKQKQNEKMVQCNEFFSTDTAITTDQSVNSLTSSVYSTSESISTDQDEEESTTTHNSLSVTKSGLSVSKLSLNSGNTNDFDCNSNCSVSAENLAVSLLRRFKEDQLPAASEIEWLVSERDAPQQILPLPNISLAEDTDNEELGKRTLLRGTLEWAPPRPQIIFTPHPHPSRRQLMEKQAYRCAGCGTKVAQKYASKFRYCEYLGRYFCTACHSEQTAIIPGRILTKWDFSKYPVSNFSYRLLDQMSTDPLFNVMDLNPTLYRRARGLQKIRLLRVALFYLKDFIFTCKYTEKLQKMIQLEKSYIYTDPDCYSLEDFVLVKNNKLHKNLSEIVKHCENHTSFCQLCRARGFMCEICGKQEIIFPWDLNSVIRCSKCCSCYHMKCYKQKSACPKCTRINNRNDLNKDGLFNETVS